MTMEMGSGIWESKPVGKIASWIISWAAKRETCCFKEGKHG